jgi:hypothetical protein
MRIISKHPILLRILTVCCVFISANFQVEAQTDLDQGLIAYYPLDSSTTNESLNRLPDTNLEALNTSYSNGRNGSKDKNGALYFKGESYARVNTPIPTDEVTVSFWLRTSQRDDRRLMGWEEFGYGARLENGGIMHWYLYEAANHPNDYWHIGSLADGQWHHVLMTYSAIAAGSVSDNFMLYVDGKAVDYEVKHLLGNPIFYGKGSLVFGANNEEAGFIGSLDDVLIYNRALTMQEIELLSAGAVPAWDEDLYTGQILHLDFAQGIENNCPNATNSILVKEYGGRITNACQGYSQAYPMRAFSQPSEGLSVSSAVKAKHFTLSFIFSSDVKDESIIAGWPDGEGYQIALNPPGHTGHLMVRCWVRRDTFYQYISEQTVTDGSCHHLAVSYDGEYFRVFLDKAKVHQDGSLSGDAGVYYGKGKMYIGNPNGHFNENTFQGKIDEIKLYNRALSEEEVVQVARGERERKSVVVKRYYRGGSERNNINPQSAFLVIKNNTGKKQKIELYEQGGLDHSVGKFKLEPNQEIVHEYQGTMPIGDIVIKD